MSLDLFGVIPPAAVQAQESAKRKETPKGYAGIPGTGPEGKCCKHCEHYAIVKYSKSYRKCLLLRPNWTKSYGTDIRANSPACSRFAAEAA